MVMIMMMIMIMLFLSFPFLPPFRGSSFKRHVDGGAVASGSVEMAGWATREVNLKEMNREFLPCTQHFGFSV